MQKTEFQTSQQIAKMHALEDLRNKMTLKVKECRKLTHPDVLELSKQLDMLIAQVQKRRFTQYMERV